MLLNTKEIRKRRGIHHISSKRTFDRWHNMKSSSYCTIFGSFDKNHKFASSGINKRGEWTEIARISYFFEWAILYSECPRRLKLIDFKKLEWLNFLSHNMIRKLFVHCIHWNRMHFCCCWFSDNGYEVRRCSEAEPAVANSKNKQNH